MSLPIIGYEDFFRITAAISPSQVSMSSEQATFPSSRLRDQKDYLVWKPASSGNHVYAVDLGTGAAKQADYFALVNHNFGSQGQPVGVAYSDAGTGGPWTNVHVPDQPDNDRTLVRTFDNKGAHRYWAVRFLTANPSIYAGEIMVGRRIEFTYGNEFQGFSPFGSQPEQRAQVTQNGRVVSNIVEYVQRDLSMSFVALPNSFVDNETAEGDASNSPGLRWWADEVAHQGKPFVWCHDPENHGDEALWGIAQGPVRRTLRTEFVSGYWNVTFRMLGVTEG